MKLKHWSGYGSINATKVSKVTKNGETVLTVKVTGNHECGLVRADKYDAFNWLLKRFDKTVEDYRKIKQLECIDQPSDSEDSCLYVFHY